MLWSPGLASGSYCVLTAALASPTVFGPCVARTKTRVLPGSKGITAPFPRMKIEKNTVWFWATITVDEAPGDAGLMHWPWLLVWQMNRSAAKLRGDWQTGVGVGVKVTVPAAPIFIAAVTMSPVPVVPGMFAIPS